MARLNLDKNGNCGRDYPTTFYRVTDWVSGRYIADFTTSHEAHEHAIKTGRRYDNKVATVSLA